MGGLKGHRSPGVTNYKLAQPLSETTFEQLVKMATRDALAHGLGIVLAQREKFPRQSFRVPYWGLRWALKHHQHQGEQGEGTVDQTVGRIPLGPRGYCRRLPES